MFRLVDSSKGLTSGDGLARGPAFQRLRGVGRDRPRAAAARGAGEAGSQPACAGWTGG